MSDLRAASRAALVLLLAGPAAALAQASAPAQAAAAMPLGDQPGVFQSGPVLAAPAAPAPSGPRFDLLEFAVEGNTVLPAIDIEQAVLPFLGPQGSMAQVEAARAALEKLYQQRGYLTVFVDVPEQRVDDGVVRLQVIEGRVSSLKVTGTRYFSQGVIRETVTALAPGQVPDFNAVQQQVAQLSRTEDRRVQPVLKPGAAPGTVDVELKVADRLPAEASIELNNRHPAATTPWRLSLNGRYNNLWQAGHSVGVTATTAPAKPSESQLLVLNYSLPQGEDNTVTAFAVVSNSLVEPVSAVTIAGKGLNLGWRWIHPLPGLDGLTHSLSAGLDYKDYRTRSVDTSSDLLTPLRYLPAQLAYNAGLAGLAGGSSFTTLSLQLNAAWGGLFRRQVPCAEGGLTDQFACSAKDADGTYAYVRGELRHSQGITGWGTVAGRLGWQTSMDPLVGNERFTLGGADSVRGYLDASTSGDRAMLLDLEWRSTNLGGAQGWVAWLDDLTALGFVSAGQTHILNALPGQAVNTALRSLGLGLQWRMAAGFSGQLDLAKPLDATADNPRRGPRAHLRLSYAL